jgi:hypothetical protein
MACAELLKVTHDTDNRVKGVRIGVQDVGNKVQVLEGKIHDVHGNVQDVGEKVRGVDDKVDQVHRSLFFFRLSHCPKGSDSFTGNQLRDNLLRWLSPPDPSINHNIAYKAHHSDTAQWFLQGNIFDQWKSTDPFLWIHGKRALFLAFIMRQPLIISLFYSGFREKCRLVRPSLTLPAL